MEERVQQVEQSISVLTNGQQDIKQQQQNFTTRTTELFAKLNSNVDHIAGQLGQENEESSQATHHTSGKRTNTNKESPGLGSSHSHLN